MRKKFVKKYVTLVAASMAMMTLLGACTGEKNGTLGQSTVEKKTENSGQSNMEGQTEDAESYVLTAQGVQLDMLNANYWMEQGEQYDGTKIIFSKQEIEAFNEANKKNIVMSDGTAYALTELPDTVDAEFLSQLIEKEALPESVTVRYGYAVEWTTLRVDKTLERESEDGDLFFDDNIQSDLNALAPVAVLYGTGDGEWYYVLREGCGGWVPAEKIALCDTKEEWLKRMNPEEFLVVTGDRITLEENPYEDGSSAKMFSMGTVLPLVKKEDVPKEIAGRVNYSNYVVKLPVRGENGKLEDQYAMVPISEKVHIGYLDYTMNNVLTQTFAHMGNVYGWGGDFHSVDCSGLVQSVHRCFGIKLPRGSVSQANVEGVKRVELAEMTEEDKQKELDKAMPGSMLFFKGHIMIYLGVVEGKHYVISSVSSFSEDQENMLSPNTVTINQLEETYRADGRSWLTHIEKITTIG